MTDADARTSWVLLTMGDRRAELRAAVASIRAADPGSDVIVVINSEKQVDLDGVGADTVVEPGENLGIPGGRDVGLDAAASDIVVFLDDDARVEHLDPVSLRRRFDEDPSLAVVSFRLVDERGDTSRRHVPRFGRRGLADEGEVATFLGGASAIRVEAYRAVGGYWAELVYGHEELDLSWRLADAGWKVRYVPDVQVFHPRTEISRHAAGWERTGRNRVLVARRNLPLPVLIVHVVGWLLLGAVRAPDRASRLAYLAGWRSGWRPAVVRRPIAWRTVWRLTRAGRAPVL